MTSICRLLPLVLVGCSTPSPLTDADPGMTGGVLRVASFTSTVQTLVDHPMATESDSATFIAIVTDDNGLDTIAGGSLMDDAGTTYAGFGAGANKGTYTASVSWEALNAIRAIDYAGDGGSRKFVAKFFDNAGNTATSTIDVALRCRVTTDVPQDPDANVSHVDDFGSACGGACQLQQIDPDHCGGCGTTCNAASYCAQGTCSPAVDRRCFFAPHVPKLQTCAALCAAVGMTCTVGFSYWNNATCANDDFPIATGGCTTPFKPFDVADQYTKPIHCFCQ